jgi:hypothetical protein
MYLLVTTTVITVVAPVKTNLNQTRVVAVQNVLTKDLKSQVMATA